MEHIQITKVTLNNIGSLQEIGRRTFSETFAAVNTAANMQHYLDESFSIHKLTDELNDTNAAFYFAWLNEEVIGYLKLNFGASQTELKDDKAIEIERIYVLQAFHGKNVGQLLYQKALQIAEEMDADYIWLGVWEENMRAIRFYQKNGFTEFSKHAFQLGDDTQTDIMMKLQLKEHG